MAFLIQPLLDAIEKNDDWNLAAPPDPNIQTWRSRKHAASFLHHYARHGAPASEKLDWMLSAGLDVNLQDGAGNSPLHCIFEQSPERTQAWADLLLARGANPNLVNAKHQTPLILATRQRHFDLIETLLKNGALKWNPEWSKEASFDVAIVCAMGTLRMQRTIEIVQKMEQIQSSCPEGKTHGLFAALEIGAWEIAKFYIRQGANPLTLDQDQNTVLHMISRQIMGYRKASKEHIDIIRHVASLGVDPAHLNKWGLKSNSWLRFSAVKAAFDRAAANGVADYIKQQSSDFSGIKRPGRRI